MRSLHGGWSVRAVPLTPSSDSDAATRPMITSSFFRSSCAVVSAAALFGAGCAAPSSAPAGRPVTSASSVVTPSSPLELDRRVAAAGRDRAAVRAIVAELVAALREPGLDQQKQQNICEQLGRVLGTPVGGDAGLAVVAPLLLDSSTVNAGRLALEAVPGAAVDQVFLDALPKVSGVTRVALVQSTGHRRLAGAVPVLAPLLNDNDVALAAAAAFSLGQIGTTEALSALLAARHSSAPAVVDARLAAAWQLPAAAGNEALQAVLADTRIASAQRAAALRSLLEREPAAAASRLVEQLSGNDVVFKQVALEAIAAHPARDLSGVLAAKVATWDAPTQQAVIAALGNRRDPAALPAVTTALSHDDEGVRLAAIQALSQLPGTPELADRLAQLAAKGSREESAAALRALARLNGPWVSAGIAAKAKEGEPALRAVYLQAIGLRNQTEALPLLFAARHDADVDVRSAALDALTELAPADAQAELLSWAIAAAEGREATRALRAFTSVSQRNRDLSTRDRALVEAINRGSLDVRLRLLPLLPRLPSALTRASAERIVLTGDDRAANAALAQLQRWPDATVLPIYAAIAQKTNSETVRKTAIEGALRLLEQSRGVPASEQSALIATLFGATGDLALRKTLVSVLGRGASAFAESFVASLQGEPALSEVVRDARAAISANQKWPPIVSASTQAAPTGNLVDGRTNTQWRVPLDGEQWFLVDLKEARPLRRLTLDQSGRAGDYPTQYEVFVSDDPATPGAAVASGSGQRDRTVIALPAGTKGRYLKVKNSEQRENASWTVSELFLD